VRFHLDALTPMVRSSGCSGPTGPGRPPQCSGPTRGLPNGRRSYRLLAEMGLSTIAQSGREGYPSAGLGGRPHPNDQPRNDWGGAVHRLVDLLTDIGFAPGNGHRPPAAGSGLRNAPF
jgi:hypothetical protein